MGLLPFKAPVQLVTAVTLFYFDIKSKLSKYVTQKIFLGYILDL